MPRTSRKRSAKKKVKRSGDVSTPTLLPKRKKTAKGKQRVERTRAGGRWTEARFWSFIRSNLRKASRRFPPIFDVLKKYRRKSQSSNKRLKWEYFCSACGEWFPQKEIRVEHIIPVGSIRSWEDVAKAAERLFCEEDGLTLHCVDCAKEKTAKERKARR